MRSATIPKTPGPWVRTSLKGSSRTTSPRRTCLRLLRSSTAGPTTLAFIEQGIPAGGLFTGAEGVKTAEEAALFGGTAGEPYDPCYHAECDDLGNISKQALSEMSDAVAHTTLTFAQTDADIRGGDGVSSARALPSAPATQGPQYRGHEALR